MSKLQLGTRAVHAGEFGIEGAVTMPIFQCATFQYEDVESYDAVRYSRLNNTPSHLSLVEKLCAISQAEAGLVTSSGMAAIMLALTGLFDNGDHLLVQKDLYGGTFAAVTNDLPRFGIEVDFLPDDPSLWDGLIRPNTRGAYFEAIANPIMSVPNLQAAVAFAQRHNLISMIDNTFASPVNFRPCEFGFDLSLHSATKYLNGHSDTVAGAVLGREDLIRTLGPRLNITGATLDPHACFLVQRGLKTLSLRVHQQNQSALALARLLDSHANVRSVSYPGLETDSSHQNARVFDGYGGMLAFEAMDAAAAKHFCSSLELGIEAPSLGGIETLVTRPATTSHKAMTPEERHSLGISDSMVRVSVGIEDTEDLLRDFEQALG